MAKLALNKQKLKSLFAIMMVSPQIKYIAYQLGISTPLTIKNWLSSGEAIQDQFSEKLEPLDNIFAFEYESVFENRKMEFDAEFRMMYELEPEGKIPDRLYVEYRNYMTRQKNKFIESQVYRRECDALEDIILSESKELDEEMKLYLQFYRIYQRGRAVKEIGYLQNVDMHAGSSKNVGLSLKMLEKMNSEDFADKQVVSHSGTIEIGTKSILGMALAYEKQQKQALEAKNENIIDVEPIKQIEEKE